MTRSFQGLKKKKISNQIYSVRALRHKSNVERNGGEGESGGGTTRRVTLVIIIIITRRSILFVFFCYFFCVGVQLMYTTTCIDP